MVALKQMGCRHPNHHPYLCWVGLFDSRLGEVNRFESLFRSRIFGHAVKHPVLNSSKGIEYPTFHAFLQSFALPNVGLFNFLVPWGEFLIGLGLIFGILTTTAAFFGLFLNFTYMLAGTISSNPWDVLFGIFIIVGGYNAGKFGGDYWVIPWVRKHITKLASAEVEVPRLSRKGAAH